VRVGFLLAMAGLFGWIGLMGTVWVVTGSSADVGRAASWKTVEVVTGDTADATTVDFKPCAGKSGKDCFKQLKAGDPELGDAQSSADKALASSAAAAPTPGAAEGGAKHESRFQPPFSTPDQYIQVAVWRMDPTTTWHIRKHKITPFGHEKHVDVVQVRPVVKQVIDPNAPPPKPIPDQSKPLTSVVMVRDLGSVKQPQFFVAGGGLMIFFVICYVLHQRDKEIWAAQAAAAANG